jgi:hypothetical protein
MKNTHEFENGLIKDGPMFEKKVQWGITAAASRAEIYP